MGTGHVMTVTTVKTMMNNADVLAHALAAANAVITEAMALLIEGSAELDAALAEYHQAVQRAEPVLRHYQHQGDVLN